MVQSQNFPSFGSKIDLALLEDRDFRDSDRPHHTLQRVAGVRAHIYVLGDLVGPPHRRAIAPAKHCTGSTAADLRELLHPRFKAQSTRRIADTATRRSENTPTQHCTGEDPREPHPELQRRNRRRIIIVDTASPLQPPRCPVHPAFRRSSHLPGRPCGRRSRPPGLAEGYRT